MPELNKNLSTTGFGLLVLTAENKNAPWLVFEAGVISKALPDKQCCPLLCDLKQTDVSGPLAQFQGTTLTSKDDMLKLVRTMNDAIGTNKVADEHLAKWFIMAWDDFAKKTGEIITARSTAPTAAAKAGPTERELIEEVLQTVRRLAIEPRMRMEEWIARMEGPIVVPPEILLREYSRLSPEEQRYMFDIIARGRGNMDSDPMMMLRKLRRLSRPERDNPPQETKKATK